VPDHRHTPVIAEMSGCPSSTRRRLPGSSHNQSNHAHYADRPAASCKRAHHKARPRALP
jgi:hypothetical protein